MYPLLVSFIPCNLCCDCVLLFMLPIYTRSGKCADEGMFKKKMAFEVRAWAAFVDERKGKFVMRGLGM